jgi:hypothetical protein
MAIKKQEFYEGAALHLLARNGGIASVRYEPPFFQFNGHLTVLLKYCTGGRSLRFTQDFGVGEDSPGLASFQSQSSSTEARVSISGTVRRR